MYILSPIKESYTLSCTVLSEFLHMYILSPIKESYTVSCTVLSDFLHMYILSPINNLTLSVALSCQTYSTYTYMYK